MCWLIKTQAKDKALDHTFKVEEDIGLIVLEHLCHKLRIHVLDVDLLQVLVEHHDGLIQFLLWPY